MPGLWPDASSGNWWGGLDGYTVYECRSRWWHVAIPMLCLNYAKKVENHNKFCKEQKWGGVRTAPLIIYSHLGCMIFFVLLSSSFNINLDLSQSVHPSISWGDGQIIFINSGVFLTKVEKPSQGWSLDRLLIAADEGLEAEPGRFEVKEELEAEPGSVKITIKLKSSSPECEVTTQVAP